MGILGPLAGHSYYNLYIIIINSATFFNTGATCVKIVATPMRANGTILKHA